MRSSLRLSPTEPQRVLALTIALGGVCGLVAVAFHVAIAKAQLLLIDRYPIRGWGWIPWVICVPAVGGAVAGLVMEKVAPGAAGSGIPRVKVAYVMDTTAARLRDAVAKFGICVVQIGSGASLGREGPTVQICAGVATALGRAFALSPANVRRLIPVGAAAGVAAAFNAPIAAVTFTIEEIVGSLDQTVLSGVVAAAALAAVVEHLVLGAHPLLEAPAGAGLHHASSLPMFAALGIFAALISVGFTDLLLWVRGRARSATKVPAWLRPGIGGLATGVLAVVALGTVHEQGIAGGGYATLGRALEGHLAAHVLAVLCGLKLLATVASYSSGGAGGIFAPALFIGAMLGGLIGTVDVALLDHVPSEELSAFAFVGMGAVFAGVVRAPITSVLIIFEMTGGYGLVLPLMIANSTAYVLARRMRPLPIYEALLEQDGIHLPHGQTGRGTLTSLDVADAMTTRLVTLDATMTIDEVLPIASRFGHSTYPVLDAEERFVGLLSDARMRRALAEGRGTARVGEIARRKDYAVPDEPLLDAVVRMTRLGVRQLPVLEAGTANLVGLLAMSDVMRAQLRHSGNQAAIAASSTPQGTADASDAG